MRFKRRARCHVRVSHSNQCLARAWVDLGAVLGVLRCLCCCRWSLLHSQLDVNCRPSSRVPYLLELFHVRCVELAAQGAQARALRGARVGPSSSRACSKAWCLQPTVPECVESLKVIWRAIHAQLAAHAAICALLGLPWPRRLLGTHPAAR